MYLRNGITSESEWSIVIPNFVNRYLTYMSRDVWKHEKRRSKVYNGINAKSWCSSGKIFLIEFPRALPIRSLVRKFASNPKLTLNRQTHLGAGKQEPKFRALRVVCRPTYPSVYSNRHQSRTLKGQKREKWNSPYKFNRTNCITIPSYCCTQYHRISYKNHTYR